MNFLTIARAAYRAELRNLVLFSVAAKKLLRRDWRRAFFAPALALTVIVKRTTQCSGQPAQFTLRWRCLVSVLILDFFPASPAAAAPFRPTLRSSEIAFGPNIFLSAVGSSLYSAPPGSRDDDFHLAQLVLRIQGIIHVAGVAISKYLAGMQVGFCLLARTKTCLMRRRYEKLVDSSRVTPISHVCLPEFGIDYPS